MRSLLLLLVMIAGTASGVLLLDGCRKKEIYRGTRVPFVVPAGFPDPAYDFSADPITEEGFQLGKRLFYDGMLSLDGAHPCSSCHQHDAAFTTYQHDRSHGSNNSHTLRNAPGLANLAWVRTYFHDGRYPDLESVIARHITRSDEMNMNWDTLLVRLNGDAAYKSQFEAAFGDATINPARIQKALKMFLLSLVVANSPYDRARRGEIAFSPSEAAGRAVFQAKCATCHTEPLLAHDEWVNVGLPIDPLLNDHGRMLVTGNRADSLRFRIPDLHNLPLTSYYSHDGRFSDIRLYIRHYRNGMQPGPTLDPRLAAGIAMTSTEEDNLVQFLFMLKDTAFINNPRFKP